MYDVKQICPTCKGLGKLSYLELRQINETTAVYLCKERNCEYPKELPWHYVERDILAINESDLSDSSDDLDFLKSSSVHGYSTSKSQLEPNRTSELESIIQELSNTTPSDATGTEETNREIEKNLRFIFGNDIALDIGKSKVKSLVDLQNQNPVSISKESKSNNDFGKDNVSVKTVSSRKNAENSLDFVGNVFAKNSLENKLQTELGININISNPDIDSFDINNIPIIFADSEEGRRVLNNAENEKESTVLTDNITKSIGKVSTPNTEITVQYSTVSQTEKVCDISKPINNPKNLRKLVKLKRMPNYKIHPVERNKSIKSISVSSELVQKEKDISENAIKINKLSQTEKATFLKKVKVIKLDQSAQSIFTINNTTVECNKVSPQKLLEKAVSKLQPQNKPNKIKNLSTFKRVKRIKMPSIKNKHMNSQKSDLSPTQNETTLSTVKKDTSKKNDEQSLKNIDTIDPGTDIGDINLDLLFNDLDSTAEKMPCSEEMDDWLKSLL